MVGVPAGGSGGWSHTSPIHTGSVCGAFTAPRQIAAIEVSGCVPTRGRRRRVSEASQRCETAEAALEKYAAVLFF